MEILCKSEEHYSISIKLHTRRRSYYFQAEWICFHRLIIPGRFSTVPVPAVSGRVQCAGSCEDQTAQEKKAGKNKSVKSFHTWLELSLIIFLYHWSFRLYAVLFFIILIPIAISAVISFL